MKVYVKSQSGKWLMPTNPANARILLKKGKVRVIQRTPFAIHLLYETTEHVQPVSVGIDDGGIHVGIAAVSIFKIQWPIYKIRQTEYPVILEKAEAGEEDAQKWIDHFTSLCNNYLPVQ